MTLRNRFKRKRSVNEMLIFTLGIMSLVALFSLIAARLVDQPVPQLKKCHGPGLSIETLKYQAYFFEANAGIHALEVAKAVQQSKRKRLTAAICMVESGGKKTAYNRRTKVDGLYQVDPTFWGKVNTKSALAMTAQHDAIMDELLVASNGNLKVALNKYGGDSTKKVYAQNILKEMERTP